MHRFLKRISICIFSVALAAGCLAGTSYGQAISTVIAVAAWKRVRRADPLMTKGSLAAAARIYLSEHDPCDARASPLYADLAGLPPVRIHVGEGEVLLDDSIRYGERLENAGGTVQVHTWEGMIHVFPSNIANLRAAKQALDDIGSFLRRQCFASVRL
jgi:epsilon-lactone hydrolase